MARPFFVAGLAGLAGLAASAVGCSRAEPGHASASGSVTRSASASPSGSAAPPAASLGASTPASSASGSSARTAAPNAPTVLEAATDGGVPGLILGALAEVGPAAPATATKEGIVLVAKDDRVLVAARTPGAHPNLARFATVDEPRAAFPPPGRGPGVAHGFAYWVAHGRLVRRSLAVERELEVLADDAREHSRVTAVELAGKTAVTFLGRADAEGTSHARLWVEGGPTLDLTPEGAGASSVSLVRAGDHLLATSIDGRSAMTPMHARRIELGPQGPELRSDVVVWVGGPAQPWTETFVGAESGRAWAHVPIERDVTHFGLATVELGAEPHMDSDVTFFDYQNGLDLAPVATAELCGHAHVAYVRPTTAVPHSPTELVLVRLGTRAATIVTTARGFASVSLAGVDGGGVLAYVADGRTWALGFQCH